MSYSLPDLENLLDNLDIGISIFDSKGTFLFVNKGVLSYTGRSREDYLNRTVYDFISAGIYTTDSAVDKVLRTRRQVSQMHITVAANGQQVARLVTVSPIFNAQGEIVYVISYQVDVDEVNKKFKHAQERNLYMLAMAAPPVEEAVIAVSRAMRDVLEDAARVARLDSTILLLGESGTGKEVVARYIHKNSGSQVKEMAAINCAALPESLLEAELFGYEKGAFTGAAASGKAGLLESANGSTLLLDEINSMPLSMQAKLLRVLETKTIIRLGSVKPRAVNFRLIAASNVDLAQCVRDGTFRADLYYRLNVVPLRIPPLRERRDDIIPLAEFFLQFYNQKYKLQKEFSPKVYQMLCKYDWPGNIRELRNLVERMVVMSETSAVVISRIPVEMMSLDPEAEDPALEEDDELRRIKDALVVNGGHREKTAKYLGISRRTLQYKLKKYGLN